MWAVSKAVVNFVEAATFVQPVFCGWRGKTGFFVLLASEETIGTRGSRGEVALRGVCFARVALYRHERLLRK